MRLATARATRSAPRTHSRWAWTCCASRGEIEAKPPGPGDGARDRSRCAPRASLWPRWELLEHSITGRGSATRQSPDPARASYTSRPRCYRAAPACLRQSRAPVTRVRRSTAADRASDALRSLVADRRTLDHGSLRLRGQAARADQGERGASMPTAAPTDHLARSCSARSASSAPPARASCPMRRPLRRPRRRGRSASPRSRPSRRRHRGRARGSSACRSTPRSISVCSRRCV